MIYLNNHEVKFTTFPNQEKRLDLDTSFLKDDHNKVIWKYQGDADIFELLLFNNAMCQLKETYNLYIGYFPYSRMDRVENQNTAFSLKVLTSLLQNELRNMTACYILDPHSPKTLELLNHYGEIAEELDFSLADHVLKDTNLNDIWVVFPDKGAAKRYDCDKYPNVIICQKTRDFQTGKITSLTAEVYKQEGTPNWRSTHVIIDDLCSYGNTFIKALDACQTLFTFQKANLIVSHAEKSMALGDVPKRFNKIYTTDSIWEFRGLEDLLPNIEVLKLQDIIDQITK